MGSKFCASAVRTEAVSLVMRTTVYSKIFAPVLLFSSLLSAGKFKTERIPMFQIISL